MTFTSGPMPQTFYDKHFLVFFWSALAKAGTNEGLSSLCHSAWRRPQRSLGERAAGELS